MTNRINGFIIALDRDIRDDDVEPILNAIRMIKGVVNVVPNVAGPMDSIAQARIRSEMYKDILDLMNKKL